MSLQIPTHPEPWAFDQLYPEAKIVKTYGQACREQALEEAAMAAEDGFKYDLNGYQIADKIRSLI